MIFNFATQAKPFNMTMGFARQLSQIKPLLHTHKLWTWRTYNIWQPCCQHRGEYNACNAYAEIKYSPFALWRGHRNETTPGKQAVPAAKGFYLQSVRMQRSSIDPEVWRETWTIVMKTWWSVVCWTAPWAIMSSSALPRHLSSSTLLSTSSTAYFPCMTHNFSILHVTSFLTKENLTRSPFQIEHKTCPNHVIETSGQKKVYI